MTTAGESEWRRGPYRISTDRARLDFAVIHGFLTTAYWSPGISRAAVERAARHSLPFGLYHDDGAGDGAGAERQIGYARVLTDYVGMASLHDVFVLETHRGQGLSLWLMQVILAHPELAEVRSWLLKTRAAHGFYARLGFAAPPDPERYMVRRR